MGYLVAFGRSNYYCRGDVFTRRTTWGTLFVENMKFIEGFLNWSYLKFFERKRINNYGNRI
ncbi:MAG: hypothetical protein A1D16_19015 [Flavihumibacter sp. CACIAM 22H1]|nr:MAG: hypothetical protein A1D16_19015 [Flavihumibacter sp. CACIAM 22H1]